VAAGPQFPAHQPQFEPGSILFSDGNQIYRSAVLHLHNRGLDYELPTSTPDGHAARTCSVSIVKPRLVERPLTFATPTYCGAPPLGESPVAATNAQIGLFSNRTRSPAGEAHWGGSDVAIGPSGGQVNGPSASSHTLTVRWNLPAG
jgi:hypothetical protein